MRGTQHRERCVESLTGLGPAPYVHETLQVSPAERNVVRVVCGRPRSPPSSVPTRPGVPDPPPRGPKAARARHAGLVARAPSSEDSEGEGEEKRIRVIVRKRPTSRSESAAAERGEETDVVHDCRRLPLRDRDRLLEAPRPAQQEESRQMPRGQQGQGSLPPGLSKHPVHDAGWLMIRRDTLSVLGNHRRALSPISTSSDPPPPPTSCPSGVPLGRSSS